MEEFVYYNNLYDIYGDLLTENERTTFEDYYQEDLSLSEIASNKDISRSAVQKTLKNVLEKLKNYEDKLHIYKKQNKIKEIITSNDITDIKQQLQKIING